MPKPYRNPKSAKKLAQIEFNRKLQNGNLRCEVQNDLQRLSNLKRRDKRRSQVMMNREIQELRQNSVGFEKPAMLSPIKYEFNKDAVIATAKTLLDNSPYQDDPLVKKLGWKAFANEAYRQTSSTNWYKIDKYPKPSNPNEKVLTLIEKKQKSVDNNEVVKLIKKSEW